MVQLRRRWQTAASQSGTMPRVMSSVPLVAVCYLCAIAIVIVQLTVFLREGTIGGYVTFSEFNESPSPLHGIHHLLGSFSNANGTGSTALKDDDDDDDDIDGDDDDDDDDDDNDGKNDDDGDDRVQEIDADKRYFSSCMVTMDDNHYWPGTTKLVEVCDLAPFCLFIRSLYVHTHHLHILDS
jgi:hypothetical protein